MFRAEWRVQAPRVANRSFYLGLRARSDRDAILPRARFRDRAARSRSYHGHGALSADAGDRDRARDPQRVDAAAKKVARSSVAENSYLEAMAESPIKYFTSDNANSPT